MKSTNNKNLWIVPIYGIFYLILFFVLENRSATYHVIHSPLDDKIPFCEYFIVPYALWFLFVAATVLYFMFYNESSAEYRKLVSVLGTGMTVFLIVSYVFPNCHNLRPTLPEDGNLCIKAVKLLYSVDTPTNLLPSIHVFNALACFAAIIQNERCRKHPLVCCGSGILTVLIILATVFLKQHSVVDVSIAFLFFGICYWIFYSFVPANQKWIDGLVRRNGVITIPNALSVSRLFLGILFWGVGSGADFEGKHTVLAMALLLSMSFDFLDSWIARKYDWVSEFGKILDSIADTVIQGILLLYLVRRYPVTELALFLFLLKEVSVLLAGSRLVQILGNRENARWHEKVSMGIFYIAVTSLILFPKIPPATANVLIGLYCFSLLCAGIRNINEYVTAYNTARGKTRWPA